MIFPLIIWTWCIIALTHSTFISCWLNITLFASWDDKMRALFGRPFLYLGIEAVIMGIRILVLNKPRIAAVVRALDFTFVQFYLTIQLLVGWGCHQLWGFVVNSAQVTSNRTSTSIDICPWIISRYLSTSLGCPADVLTLRPDVKSTVFKSPLSGVIDNFEQFGVIDDSPLHQIVIAAITLIMMCLLLGRRGCFSFLSTCGTDNPSLLKHGSCERLHTLVVQWNVGVRSLSLIIAVRLLHLRV